MTPIKSSSITHASHDPVTNTMRLKFASGATYEYKGVKSAEYAAFIAAKSAGAHFQSNIRTKFKGAKCK